MTGTSRRLVTDALLALSLEDVAVLALYAGVIRRRARSDGMETPHLIGLLDEVTRTARECLGPRANSEVGSEVTSETAEISSEGKDLRWLTVQQSAERLGVGERRIVQLLAKSDLTGRRRGQGRGVWDVDEASVGRYAAGRTHHDRKAG